MNFILKLFPILCLLSAPHLSYGKLETEQFFTHQNNPGLTQPLTRNTDYIPIIGEQANELITALWAGEMGLIEGENHYSLNFGRLTCVKNPYNSPSEHYLHLLSFYNCRATAPNSPQPIDYSLGDSRGIFYSLKYLGLTPFLNTNNQEAFNFRKIECFIDHKSNDPNSRFACFLTYGFGHF